MWLDFPEGKPQASQGPAMRPFEPGRAAAVCTDTRPPSAPVHRSPPALPAAQLFPARPCAALTAPLSPLHRHTAILSTGETTVVLRLRPPLLPPPPQMDSVVAGLGDCGRGWPRRVSVYSPLLFLRQPDKDLV